MAAGAGWSKGRAGWDNWTMTLQPLSNKGQDLMDNHPAFSPLGGAGSSKVCSTSGLREPPANRCPLHAEVPLSNTRFIVFPLFIDCLPNQWSVPKSLSQRLLLREHRLNQCPQTLGIMSKRRCSCVFFSGKGYRALLNPQQFLPQTLRKSKNHGSSFHGWKELLLSGLI